jgi:hypothetical protein
MEAPTRKTAPLGFRCLLFGRGSGSLTEDLRRALDVLNVLEMP